MDTSVCVFFWPIVLLLFPELRKSIKTKKITMIESHFIPCGKKNADNQKEVGCVTGVSSVSASLRFLIMLRKRLSRVPDSCLAHSAKNSTLSCRSRTQADNDFVDSYEAFWAPMYKENSFGIIKAQGIIFMYLF